MGIRDSTVSILYNKLNCSFFCCYRFQCRAPDRLYLFNVFFLSKLICQTPPPEAWTVSKERWPTYRWLQIKPFLLHQNQVKSENQKSYAKQKPVPKTCLGLLDTKASWCCKRIHYDCCLWLLFPNCSLLEKLVDAKNGLWLVVLIRGEAAGGVEG